jgi:hypothetical protein
LRSHSQKQGQATNHLSRFSHKVLT